MNHNLGVAPVAGVYQAFPYPVAFYLLAHLGNSFYHAPDLWLKLGGALLSALALLPVGYLARRLSGAPQVDFFAGVIYLFTPAYTRSLLLLELSALLGHLLDLIIIAYLARISLSLFPARRIVATMVLIAASLAVYTSGFIHQGLLVASLLILAPFLGGLSRAGAFRLAGAGLAGAALGLLTYHPETVSNVFAATLPAGTDVPGATELPLGSRLTSAIARALEFLGGPVIVLGTAGVTYGIKRARSTPLRFTSRRVGFLGGSRLRAPLLPARAPSLPERALLGGRDVGDRRRRHDGGGGGFSCQGPSRTPRSDRPLAGGRHRRAHRVLRDGATFL